MKKAAALVALIALGTSAYSEDVYKCRDTTGRPTYQSTPCLNPQQSEPMRDTTNTYSISTTEPPQFRPSITNIAISPNGCYYIDGTINGIRTPMQIDTGASAINIPAALGYRAGMTCQSETTIETANGSAKVCNSKVRELQFGTFVVQNFPALLTPNLKMPLIGMSILKLMHITLDNGTIHLTY